MNAWVRSVLVGVGLVAAARADVELSGFMQVGTQCRFILTDLEDHVSSPWLAVGQSFHGYELVGFDPQRQILSVRSRDERLELALRGSHVLARTLSLPPDVAARGITSDDLLVRDTGPVRIRLSVGAQELPVPRRYVRVNFDNGTDRCAIELGTDGPQTISRALVPEAVEALVADDDIAAINAHLATVRPKWFAPP